MTLYVYKVKISDITHKGVLFATDFYQAMYYLGEAYDPEMEEVFIAAVDDATVLELSPEQFERVYKEGAFYDGYSNI